MKLSKNSLKFGAFAAGFSAMIVQLVLLRELMSVFEGNELVLGIALGNWMLLMGLGALLGKWKKLQTLPAIFYTQILQIILPVITVFALRALRHIIFLRGSTIDIWQTFLSCFLILLPFCLSAGCFLVLISNLIERRTKNKKSVGEIYTFDNFGCVIGGLVFTFLILQYTDHFTALSFAILANLVGLFLIARAERQKFFLLFGGVLTIFTLFVYNHVDLDRWSKQLEYPNEKIIFQAMSPYGDLFVTENAGQYDFFQNGVPIFSSQNVEAREEAVHFAMTQRPNAKSVIILGNGITGTAKEALKYPVQSLDAVELDTLVVYAAKKLIPENFNNSRINLYQSDERLFLHKSHNVDVILLGTPEPSTLQYNRFYTANFFKEVKNALHPDGVFSFTLGNYENYLSPEFIHTLAITKKTLQATFKNVLLLPGTRVHFLASDGELTPNIAQRLEAQNIPTQWINQHFLRAFFTPERLAELKNLPANVPINRDFTPVLYFQNIQHWLSRFDAFYVFPFVLIFICTFIYLFQLKPIDFSIFVVGFAAAGIELILLAGFQIIHGNLYHKIGLIITIFMLGITLGSFASNRYLKEIKILHLKILILLLALYICVLPWILALFSSHQSWIAFFIPTLIPSFLAGMIFPAAIRLSNTSAPSSPLYQADYIGAFLGFLLMNTLLLPLLGFITLCFAITAFCLIAVLILCRA